MAGQLLDKVAVVTGDASGIGRATVLRFATEGANIVIGDLDATRGEETTAAIRANGGSAIFVRTDTTSEADCDALADAAMQEFGRLDVCLAAAGISDATYVSGQESPGVEMLTTDESHVQNLASEQWEKVIDVNLKGVFLTDRAVSRQMIAAGNGGAIVNIASIAAKVPLPGAAPYCVSKAGVWMLTKVMAVELTPYDIRVNAIGPGFIETPMTATLAADETGLQMMLQMTPMNRLGQPEEIAATALFLASGEGSYFTGELLHPGGGMFHG